MPNNLKNYEAKDQQKIKKPDLRRNRSQNLQKTCCFIGVSEADYLVRMLQGYTVKTFKATQDKVTRSLPVSSQAEAGNIKILQASWNEDFLRELENFPEGGHDDIVDAFSGAFLMLADSTYDLSGITTF